MLAFGEITITEVFDGVSVSSVDVWFYPSTSQTHLVGGSWTTNAPQARDGIWIWSKTITTLSDGTKKESSPTCVTGAKGAVGKSIDKLEEEYYLSSSKITQTGGSWVKTPPVWVFGKYMWTRVKITYKNPTSVEYSIPICDSSWEAANGFKEELNGLITQNQTAISGVSSKVNEVEKSITNKVWKDDITTEINTYDSSTVQTIRNNVAENKTEIGKITNTVSDVQSTLKTKADGSTVQTLTERVAKAEQDASGFKQTVEQNYITKGDFDNLDIGGRNLLLESNVPNRNSSQTGYPAGVYALAEGLIEGETYTVTIRGTFTKAATWAVYIGGGTYGTQFHPVNGDGRKTLAITFQCTADMAASNQIANFYIRDKTNMPTAGEASVDIHWVKLEKGDKSTDWSPAPEDVKNQMSSIKSELIQKADKIEAKVNTNAGDISSLSITTSGLTTSVETAQGDISKLQQTANSLTSDISGAKGEISKLKQTSSTLTSELSSANGEISKLQQTAKGLTSDVATAKGDISSLKQTTSGLQSTVQTAQGDISSLKQTANTLVSDMSNAKGDISNLKQKADEITLEVGSTVKDTVEEFYLSNSPTSLVGGSWSTTQPTWTQGKFIWRRTKVTYGGNKTNYTPSTTGVCITGNTGATGSSGSNGKDGKGIRTIVNYYLASASGTNVTTSTSGWTTTIQTINSSKKFLWNYEKITYTDDSVYQSIPCIIGTYGRDGSNGANGVGIQSIEEFYQISNSSSTPPTSWQITIPTMTESQRYLWNYEKTTYTNGTTHETKKRVIGVHGNKGLQGIPGKDGTNGRTTYFHIKYSSVANPTTSSQMTETPSTYIGTYVDFEQIDSTDPKRYTWSRFAGIQGDKGENGIPGKNGLDGKTSYLHIAYANSSDGRNGFDISNSTGKLYIGQYTDFVQADSTDPTRYSWTKIKGENGVNGKDGKGIRLTEITYQASASGTQAPTGTWQSSIPTVPKGQYLWSKTTVTYTDNTKSTSYSVAYIPTNGINGQNGQNGSGVSNMIQQYYLSTSKTTQTGGSWVTTMPQWSIGKYLWTRYQVNHTNPTSVSYTTPVCDSSWEAVNEIQIGGRNLVLNSNIEYSNPNYLVASYNISPVEGTPMSNGCGHLVHNEQYTISVCWTPGSKTSSLNCFLSQGYSGLGCLYTDGTQNRQITSLVITAKYTASRFPVDDARNGSVDFYRLPNVSGTVYDDVTIHWVQIEKGNKATDWSPAPEDLDASIKDAHDKISQNDKQIQEAFSKIQIMKDSICSIVTSQDGSTVLEQTGGGFKFNITAIKKEVQQALEDCTNLSGDLSNTNATVDNLEKSLKGLDDKTAYIRMIVDENGKPCMELGKEMNDEFKVRITNSSIDFFDGTIRVAYINNKSLYIEKAVIKSELQIGDRVDAQGNVQGFIWATRSNGNMGLRKVAKGGAVSGIMHN